MEDTMLVKGVVVDKDFSHPQMPKVRFLELLNNRCEYLRMYCIVRPMVPENNVPCTYHCLHVLSILVEES